MSNGPDTVVTAPASSRRSLLSKVLRVGSKRPLDSARTSVRFELLVLVTVVLLPVVANSNYVTTVTTQYLSFALLAVSLDILWGYAGLISFGQGAIFGLGAYALGVTLQHTSGVWGTYLGLIAAVAISTALGAIIGWVVFSVGQVVSGFGFAIVTLAVGLILQLVATDWSAVTGGFNGLYGYAPMTVGVPGLQLTADTPLRSYYLVAIAAGAVYVGVRLFLSSKVGLIVRAISQNDARAETLGHSVSHYRILAVAVSSGVGGFAGALYLPSGIVTPSQMALDFSTLAIIWVAIGGRGTLIGPVVGAVGLNWIQTYLSGKLLTLSTLATGVLLVLIVLVWPNGLVGAVRSLGQAARSFAR